MESPWQSGRAAEWLELCEVLAGAVAGGRAQTGREGEAAALPVAADCAVYLELWSHREC